MQLNESILLEVGISRISLKQEGEPVHVNMCALQKKNFHLCPLHYINEAFEHDRINDVVGKALL